MTLSSSKAAAVSSLRFWAALFACVATISAHVPVPDSVLAPKNAAEAWNVIRLSSENVDRLLSEQRLAEIPDQISLCSPALRALSQWANESQRKPAAEAAVRASTQVAALGQAAMAGDKATAQQIDRLLHEAMGQLALCFDPQTVAADVYNCPMHPDFVSGDPKAHCDKCGMSLLKRRIPYSFVYMAPGEPTIQLTAKADNTPRAGQPLHVKVTLARRNGAPVRVSDLVVTHTQPIHLLIIDPSLEDYHHEHPKPTGVPGEYEFTFTPAKSSEYRVFADVVPAETGVQEYPFTTLAGDQGSSDPIDDNERYECQSANLKFRLSIEGSSLHVGQPAELRIDVSNRDGIAEKSLEPVMSAFAHLVGFYDDRKTVVHLHPFGPEALDPRLRGGPTLNFKFFPPKPGPLHLFCQVQEGGLAVFAPLCAVVMP